MANTMAQTMAAAAKTMAAHAARAAARVTGLTADEYRDVNERLRWDSRLRETMVSITAGRGTRTFLAGPRGIWEIVGAETVLESPEWKWAAHAIHNHDYIYTCKAIYYTGGISDPVYADGPTAYFSRVTHNTQWVGESPADVIRGTYPSRELAVAAVAAMRDAI